MANTTIIFIVLGVVLVLIILLISSIVSIYNKLIKLKNTVKDQWSLIDVFLKRRADLIPNLVETVKGYAKHESKTLEAVISARNSINNSKTTKEEMEANGDLTNALSRLMVLTESYPELKANSNFISLQNDLKETEDKIQYARQFYNDAVTNYTNKLEMFPSNIVASMFNFKKEEYFEATEEDKENPQVKF